MKEKGVLQEKTLHAWNRGSKQFNKTKIERGQPLLTSRSSNQEEEIKEKDSSSRNILKMELVESLGDEGEISALKSPFFCQGS